MRPSRSPSNPSGSDHGQHTLKVWRGTIVGLFGRDVFVELGPRMQGVIPRDHFATPPAMGQEHDFTLRGLEEGLWSLALREERSLPSWEQMEIGSLVHARVVRLAPGGVEVKIGALHGFMPKSHSGLPRDEKLDGLVGRNLACEVIEVDTERQRVTVSHKLCVQRERESERARHVDRLRIGQVVHGRVTRIEDYGAFVAFGQGMTGMVHVSNLCHERVAHPSEIVELGQSLELKVLHIRNGGKRIALGLKQMTESPWRALERELFEGQIMEGVVVKVLDFGAFVAVRAGVEGLLPASEAGLAQGQLLRSALSPGQKLSVRVLDADFERERLSFSLLGSDGARLAPDEAENARTFHDLVRQRVEPRPGADLGRALREVLEPE